MLPPAVIHRQGSERDTGAVDLDAENGISTIRLIVLTGPELRVAIDDHRIGDSPAAASPA